MSPFSVCFLRTPEWDNTTQYGVASERLRQSACNLGEWGRYEALFTVSVIHDH